MPRPEAYPSLGRRILHRVWGFLASIETCAWLSLAFCLAGAAGSVTMGRYPGLFGDMDAGAFADWFARKGFLDPAPTSWLYGLLLATALLAANTACCTADRLVRLFRGAFPARRLLPHVMHAAFLCVLLACLAGSLYGDRIPGVSVPRGMFAPVGGTGWVLRLDRFEGGPPLPGYPMGPAASVTLFRDTTPLARGVVRANAPLFHAGYGIYLKKYGTTRWGVPYAVFDVNRDPAAPAALAAALLFTAANLLYLIPSRRSDA